MKNNSAPKQKIADLLDRWQCLLFPRTRQSDVTGMQRSATGPGHKAVVVLRKTLVGLSAIFLLASFIGIFYFYANSMERISSHPLVTNLANPTFPAAFRFGDSPMCEVPGGERECWIGPNFDDEQWTRVGLPSFDIHAQEGYRQALGKAHAYYRLQVPVPDTLLNRQDTIAFSPSWINHEKFQIFLNGRLVYEGDGKKTKQSLATLPIPRSDIINGYTTIVIKGSMNNAAVGIRHHGGIYVGPKEVIDELYASNDRISVTYFLLILLSKGSVFVIFALFYFFTKGQRGFFDFLLYALCVTLENIFIMSQFISDFNIRVLCYFTTKTIAIFALQRFFAHHYEVHRVRRKLFIAGFFQIAGILAMTIDQGWGSKSVTIPMLLQTTNILLLATLASAILVGLINLRMYRQIKVSASMQRELWEFIGFTTVYFALLTWEGFFNEYKGTDMRSVFDLLFFYYMALVSARNSGLNEGKVITLEAHMDEKRRMESELKEAAAIAKAFLPDRVPRWESLGIGVHHKPFTESSGDWFAFERSSSGDLYHCLICDITGHGVQAAIIVSACKTTLISMLANDPKVLERKDFIEHYARILNQTLYSHGSGYHTTTLFGMTFEPKAEKLYYLSAGHPPALHISQGAAQERPVPLVTRNNVLGVLPDFCGKMKTHTFQPGDQLIAYTDGIPITSHIRTLTRFISEAGENPANLDTLSKALYDSIWETEEKRTKRTPDDDVSIIWFRAA